MFRATAVFAALSITMCGGVLASEAPFEEREVATFERPWSMAFLPDGRLLLTEKAGTLLFVDPATGERVEVAGVPEVEFGGQGGLGDVLPHPDFESNRWVYLSYAERGGTETVAERGESGDSVQGAAVARAVLTEADGTARLDDLQVIWRQIPKVPGKGHYGHRLRFSDAGDLFIASGERQKFDPAQDMTSNLGKVLRLRPDGTVPPGNPFAADGSQITAQIWSSGHRNPLGIDFDADGRLWVVEMGPKGGDELNLVVRGADYGYPVVSNGDHYDGRPIPDHSTRPEFSTPEVWWTPVISPSDMIVYRGDSFAPWRGDALITGLSSKALVRVRLGETATEVERWDMGRRIRSIEEGPGGSIWILEDGRGGKLVELVPRRSGASEGTSD